MAILDLCKKIRLLWAKQIQKTLKIPQKMITWKIWVRPLLYYCKVLQPEDFQVWAALQYLTPAQINISTHERHTATCAHTPSTAVYSHLCTPLQAPGRNEFLVNTEHQKQQRSEAEAHAWWSDAGNSSSSTWTSLLLSNLEFLNFPINNLEASSKLQTLFLLLTLPFHRFLRRSTGEGRAHPHWSVGPHDAHPVSQARAQQQRCALRMTTRAQEPRDTTWKHNQCNGFRVLRQRSESRGTLGKRPEDRREQPERLPWGGEAGLSLRWPSNTGKQHLRRDNVCCNTEGWKSWCVCVGL